MSRMNAVRLLAASVSAFAVATALPALAQTTVVVGAPEGSPPGAVGGSALAPGSTTALGSNGRLIFNHNGSDQSRYVIDPTVRITGSAGSRMDLVAGTTTFTSAAPYRGPDNAFGQTAVNPTGPASGFLGETRVRSGATLEMAAWFGFRQLAENGKFVVYANNAFQNNTLQGARFTLDQGGRLTGQGRIEPTVANTGDTVLLAGVVSPHGFAERGGEYEGLYGKMVFGNALTRGNLVFTSTSVLEMDVDATASFDGKRLINDLIETSMNTRIRDGAQLRVRLARSGGATTYLPGRTFELFRVETTALKTEAHKHVYQFDYSTVDLTTIDWTNPPAWLNPQYVAIGSVPAPTRGDKLVIDGRTYLYSSDINQDRRGITGMFTLAPDSDTQLTHYLGLDLKKLAIPVTQYGETQNVDAILYLEIVQNRQFTEDAQSANGAAAAAALQTIGVYNPMFTRLLNLQSDAAAITSGELPAFFDALSGELHVGVRGLLSQDVYQIQRSLSRRLGGYEPGGHHIWAEALGGRRELESDNTAALEEDSYGFLAGIDATVVGPWRLGVSAGYRQADISGPDAFTGEADITSQTYLTAYTTGAWRNWRAHVGAGLSNAKIETRRSVVLTGVTADELTAAYDGTVLNGFGELSYRIPLSGMEVEPFVGGTLIRSETDLVRETGKIADSGTPLTIVGDQNQVQFATVGVKARATGRGPIMFDGSLGYRRGFGDLELIGRHMLNNRVDIPMVGARLSENAAVVEAGALWRVNEAVTANLGYSGVIGDEGADHNVGLGLSVRF